MAFDYKPVRQLRTDLNLFTYDIDGLIEFVADAGQTTLTAQNARDVEGNGFELEADWLAADALRLRGNFAWQRSKDKATGELTPNTPGRKFYANADWTHAELVS